MTKLQRVTPVPKHLIARMDRVLEKFAGLKQAVTRVLDVSCGDGTIALQIKDACNAVEVYGVDQDNESISLAKEKSIKTFILESQQSASIPKRLLWCGFAEKC